LTVQFHAQSDEGTSNQEDDGQSITDSARKKTCTVQTALANNVKTYVSIVRDMIPGAPALQDVLKVCLTQASLEAKT
jgi:hypothetical protein